MKPFFPTNAEEHTLFTHLFVQIVFCSLLIIKQSEHYVSYVIASSLLCIWRFRCFKKNSTNSKVKYAISIINVITCLLRVIKSNFFNNINLFSFITKLYYFLEEEFGDLLNLKPLKVVANKESFIVLKLKVILKNKLELLAKEKHFTSIAENILNRNLIDHFVENLYIFGMYLGILKILSAGSTFCDLDLKEPIVAFKNWSMTSSTLGYLLLSALNYQGKDCIEFLLFPFIPLFYYLFHRLTQYYEVFHHHRNSFLHTEENWIFAILSSNLLRIFLNHSKIQNTFLDRFLKTVFGFDFLLISVTHKLLFERIVLVLNFLNILTIGILNHLLLDRIGSNFPTNLFEILLVVKNNLKAFLFNITIMFYEFYPLVV